MLLNVHENAKVVIESDLCANVRFFALMNVSSLRIVFLKHAKGYQYFLKKHIIVTINQLKNSTYLHVISLPQG